MDTSPSLVRPRRALRVTAAVALALTLSGCGVRLETPPPSEPSLTAAEAARRAAVTDVLDVRATALAAIDGTKGRPAEILETVLHAADVHEAQLGGVYVSGLVGEDGSPAPRPTGTPAGTDVAATVEILAQAASRARAGLETVEDPGFARLSASIAVADLAAARTLAAAADVEAPATEFPIVAPVPTSLEGVPEDDLVALVTAEDSTGYMLEVLASRLSGPQRSAALARAATHRSRADAWARAAGLASTPEDPRRVAYALPEGITAGPPDTGLVGAAESDLATDLITLVGVVPAASRAAMADLAADTWAAALTWGAAAAPLPGMPEHAQA